MKPPRRAIYNILLCVRRTTLARPRGFDFFRTRKSPLRRPTFAFRAHSERRHDDNQRRTERVSTLVATEYDRTERISTLWSRPSSRSAVYREHLHFGRSRVRGAPRAGRRWRGAWRGRAWPKLSMARSTRRRCIGASGVITGSGAAPLPRGTRCVWPRAPDTLWRRFYTPLYTQLCPGVGNTGPGRWEGRHILRDFDREMYFAAKLADWSFFPCFTDDARWYSGVSGMVRCKNIFCLIS